MLFLDFDKRIVFHSFSQSLSSCYRVATKLLSSYLSRVEIYTRSKKVRHHNFTVFHIIVNDSRVSCTSLKARLIR